MTDQPRQPASQVLAEAAAALHSVEKPDAPDWTTLTEDEKVPYIARIVRPTFAVVMTTRPQGWAALCAQIVVVDHAITRAYPQEAP